MTRHRVLAVLWTVAVFVGCSIPGESLPRAPMLSFDKVVHIVMFVGVAGLWLRALPGRGRAIFLACIAFAVGIEIWQQLPFIGRSADPFDAIADGIGALLGLGLETARARWAQHRVRLRAQR